METLKNAHKKKKKDGNNPDNSDDEGLYTIEGLCECVFSCKPCLFSLYYLDRCNRCLKKPSSHIYKILFNFK
jgi:hypothetical protein